MNRQSDKLKQMYRQLMTCCTFYYIFHHECATVGAIPCENISFETQKIGERVDVLWLVWNSQKWPCLSGFTQFNALHSVKVFLALPFWISIWLFLAGCNRSLIGSTQTQLVVTASYVRCDWSDVLLIMPYVTWVGMAMAGVIMWPGAGGGRGVSGWVKADGFGYPDISAN